MTETLNMCVRSAIDGAMRKLLAEKPFRQITITELVQTAGVGRSSYYRNYNSMEEIVFSCLNRLYDEYFQSRASAKGLYQKNTKAVLLSRYKFVKENADFFSALVRDGLLYPAYQNLTPENVERMFGINFGNDRYFKSQMLASAASNIDIWVSGGFQESENWLAEYTMRFMKFQKKILDHME